MNAAQPGDEILVGPGVYTEPLVLAVDALTICSLAGAGVTILDGLGSHRILLVDGTYNLTLRGLTFRNGVVPGGGGFGAAILAWHGPTVVIEECVFVDNAAGWDNAAIHARHAGTSVTCTDCLFENNLAEHNGGACGAMFGAALTLQQCTFADNRALIQAGACNAFSGGQLEITDSLFYGNSGGHGAVIVNNASGHLSGNTFHGNQSLARSTVVYFAGASGSFERNIVSGELTGSGFEIDGATCTHDCNLYPDNAKLDIVGTVHGPGDILADPLFCLATVGDFTVCADSPVLAANNACGVLIGALGDGCPACGVVPVSMMSWSEVKGVFR